MSIFDEEIPEIKVEELEASHITDDVFKDPVAKRFAFVGVGAAGGRIVNEFYLKGYRKTVAVNTCEQDREGLNRDLEFIDLNIGGSGKNPEVSRQLLRQSEPRAQLTNYFNDILGDNIDYIFVCAGLGGGTGSGGGPELINLLREYALSCQCKAKVGCILSLPQPLEGSRVARNALEAVEEFVSLAPTPFIIIDNGRVNKLHKSTVASLYDDANKDVVKMLHALNTLAAMPARQTFDGADFGQLLDSGMITMGMSGVRDWKKGADTLAQTILSTFRSATLADMDTSSATQGVCILAAGVNVLNSFSNDEMMRGLGLLHSSSKCDSIMLHPGIYTLPGKNHADTLIVYVALGGLRPNPEVFKQLAQVGNVNIESKLASFFGIK